MTITATTPYFKIYPFISQSAEINSTEKLIYSYLYSFNQAEKTITVSNEYMAELFDMTIRGIQKSLNSLEEKRWITKINTKSGRIICTNFQPDFIHRDEQ